MKKLIVIFLLLILTVFISCSASLLNSIADGINNMYSVYIENRWNQTLNFQLSSDGYNWKTFCLYPGHYNTYTLGGQQNGFIRIMTANGAYAQYRINLSGRYGIAWNYVMNRWDIVSL